MSNWAGSVLLWEDHGVFAGAAGDAEVHESPAIKICVSTSTPYSLSTDGSEWTDEFAAIIPAGVRHAIGGRASRMIMILIAPEGELGRRLRKFTEGEQIVSLDGVKNELAEELGPLLDGVAESAAETRLRNAVGLIAPEADAEDTALDPRVAQSIDWIRTGRDSGILVKDIAAEVDLSESRFSHLFTEFVRVPVRRYLLWLRLRDALHSLATVKNLTEAAHTAGFADSAHLSRTFRNALGIAPTDLVKSSSVESYL